jgi:hypothetical protein
MLASSLALLVYLTCDSERVMSDWPDSQRISHICDARRAKVAAKSSHEVSTAGRCILHLSQPIRVSDDAQWVKFSKENRRTQQDEVEAMSCCEILPLLRT